MNEDQERTEKLKIHLNSLLEFLADKARIVPVIASLSATVLVVATFNPNLLIITTGLKITLTILLTLIPTSLLFHLLEISNAIRKADQAIKDLHNVKELLPPYSIGEKIYNYVVGYFPFIGILILGGCIIYIISALWY